MPKNEIGPNLVLNRVTSTGFNIAGAPTGTIAVPPSDLATSADTNVDGSVCLTPTNVFQRLAGTWTALTSGANTANGRFITGNGTILTGNSRVLITMPFGASNGDRVFITADSDTTNANVAVVMYSTSITGGNLQLTARAAGGAVQTVTNNTTLFYMIDTSS
jgi:hypothetical protein